MSSYEDEIKRFREQAVAELQKQLNEAIVDPLQVQRRQVAFELGYVRLRRKMSQSELAEKTGIPQPRISRIERGRANPSLNTLLKIIEALESDIMIEYRGKATSR